jgi:hypothetical protein
MGKKHTEGGEVMIADELRVLFDDLRADIASLKLDVMLISHDVAKIREELEQTQRTQQPQESIGIAPGTPPPDFLPPELM